MPTKRFRPEQIVNLVRKIEVEIAKGKKAAQAAEGATKTEAAKALGYRPPVPAAYSPLGAPRPFSQPEAVM